VRAFKSEKHAFAVSSLMFATFLGSFMDGLLAKDWKDRRQAKPDINVVEVRHIGFFGWF
jgi:hypothetical protein